MSIRSSTDAAADLAGIVARHQAEMRRLESTRIELCGRVPLSLLSALDCSAAASLGLIIECQRVRGGVLDIDDAAGGATP